MRDCSADLFGEEVTFLHEVRTIVFVLLHTGEVISGRASLRKNRRHLIRGPFADVCGEANAFSDGEKVDASLRGGRRCGGGLERQL